MSTRAAAMLEAHRDELNARYAKAAGDASPDGMLGYLRRTVMPILDGWEGEPSAAVLFALFDAGVVGLRIGLVGAAEQTAFEHILRDGMPALRAHVQREPGVMLRVLGNGYLHMLREGGPEVAGAWLHALAAGAPQCPDRAALLHLGVVIGWRAGLAEAREVALEAITSMEPALVQHVFGTTSLDHSDARRFCTPGARAALGRLQHVATAGGFVGFGGPFVRPPQPRVVGGRLVCTDYIATFELFADVFGVRFRPAVWAHAEAVASTNTGEAHVYPGDVLHALGEAVTPFAELRGATAAAACNDIVAVTLVDSHQVLVLGRREATA